MFTIFRGHVDADRVLTPKCGADVYRYDKTGAQVSAMFDRSLSWSANLGDKLALFGRGDAGAEIVGIENSGWAFRVRKFCGDLLLPCDVEVVKLPKVRT